MSKSRKKQTPAKQKQPASSARFYALVLFGCAAVFGVSYYLFVPRPPAAKRAKVEFVAPEKPAWPKAMPKTEDEAKPLRTEGSPIDAAPEENQLAEKRNWPAFFDTLPDRPVGLENPDAYLQFARGMKQLERARMREARAHLARAVELSPDTASYNAWYAYVLYLTGRFEMAEPYLLKAKELGYDDPLLFHYLDLILPPPAPDEAAQRMIEEEKSQNPN